MADETRLVPIQGAAVAATPVPVNVAELEPAVVGALELLAKCIPDLRRPLPETVRKARSGRTVSREAVTAIIAMVESSPRLRQIASLDPAHAREVVASADAYRAVAEHLKMLLDAVKHTAEARWAEVASSAVRAYHMATLMTDEQDPELAGHIANIRTHLGRRNGATGKKRKKA